MNLHQIVSGACNAGDKCFAVGSVEGVPFTAYAAGCNIVILASTFERVQIIPGAVHDYIRISSIDCSSDTGKIAAAYENTVCIYEPTPLIHHNSVHKQFRFSSSHSSRSSRSSTSSFRFKPRYKGLDYRWVQTGTLKTDGPIRALSWNLEGTRLLTAGANLQLWHLKQQVAEPEPSVTFTLGGGPETDDGHEEHENKSDEQEQTSWNCVWKANTAVPVQNLAFSPDGTLFATCGENDRLVKIWYENKHFLFTSRNTDEPPELDYGFVYIAHPRAVTHLSWRTTSKYMPKGSVSNMLLTSCKDNICRLWVETVLPEDGLVNLSQLDPQANHPKFRTHRHKHRFMQRLKHMKTCFHIRRNAKHHGHGGLGGASAPIPTLPSTYSVHDFHSYGYHGTGVTPGLHFHLAASVNAETDIPLVPSISYCNPRPAFVLHWLDNKEMQFSLQAEVFLEEFARPVAENPESDEVSLEPLMELGQPDGVDARIESFLRDWHHSPDLLFSIHPVDGSFLIWVVEWLDEFHPGSFRQAQVSFSTRIPSAFPLGDSMSMSTTVSLYSTTPLLKHLVKECVNREIINRNLTSVKEEDESKGDMETPSVEDQNETSPVVYLVTKHDNGTLNLWHITFADQSKFAQVLSIGHKSRASGHRFRVNDITCHPVLPLLLTTSHHNIIDKDKLQSKTGFCSELILWKVDAVGPLSKSGGICELARISSPEPSAFSNVAWIPTLLPSSTLGNLSNSPSACFVASDGQCLRVYQAVIDARTLLADLVSFKENKRKTDIDSTSGMSDMSSLLEETLLENINIVSQQSTSRPGCIIQLETIAEAIQWQNTTFLHVYQEQLITGQRSSPTNPTNQDAMVDLQLSSVFEEPFFIVLLDCTDQNTIIHMWKLTIASTDTETSLTASQMYFPDSNLVQDETNDYSRRNSIESLHLKHGKVSPHINLTVTREIKQILPLPDGVEIVHATPASGHLSSASIYPACLAPYCFATACSDSVIRFWTVSTNSIHLKEISGLMLEENGEIVNSGKVWTEWNMIKESAIEIDGQVLNISVAYSGRVACAYKYGRSFTRSNKNDQDARYINLCVAIYECESTGGTEWVLEDVIHLKNIHLPRIDINKHLDLSYLYDSRTLKKKQRINEVLHTLNNDDRQTLSVESIKPTLLAVPSFTTLQSLRKSISEMGNICPLTQKHIVQLDWVSNEDGSHILTVACGSKIMLYTPLSTDLAQANVKAMKESINNFRPILRKASSLAQPMFVDDFKWMTLRKIELQTADGLPALPMQISWVRDGILVVGMDSEMHVYTQWKPQGSLNSQSIGEVDNNREMDFRMLTSENQKKLAAVPTLGRISSVNLQILDRKRKEQNIDYMPDYGLFEASRIACPVLPQYHPKQLMELLNSGKIRWVKAILAHLVKCIGGNLQEPPEEVQGWARSRTLSVSYPANSPEHRASITEITLDYDEISNIPPLPLYTLLAADKEQRVSQEEQKDYEQLFDMNPLMEESLDTLLEDQDVPGLLDRRASERNVGLTHFTPKQGRILSRLLTHMHLPGLSSLDQMHLLALADTVATCNTDLAERFAIDAAKSAMAKENLINHTEEVMTDNLDDCGLRFLLSMKHYNYLLRCLPLAQRNQFQKKGVGNNNLAWAFHSESQEELLNLIPSYAKGCPTWPQLRELGIGWWVRNITLLRQSMQILAKAAFQSEQDPMDAAIYYLAMNKKSLLWGLFRSKRDERMTAFFSNTFTEDRWRKAALKNAYALLGKQRFEHAAAFFLLAGNLKDAVEICLHKMNDLQLAIVITRLYEGDGDSLKKLLHKEILGFDEEGVNQDLTKAHPDPFLRSMALWILKEYPASLNTLLIGNAGSQHSAHDDEAVERTKEADPNVFNFYVYLRTHPLLVRQHLSSYGQRKDCLPGGKQILLENSITPLERQLYFTTAHGHFRAGCPALALEVLSKIPHVVNDKQGKTPVTSPKEFKEHQKNEISTGIISWNSKPQINEAADNFDWGAPVNDGVKTDDLDLKWSDDEGGNESDESGGLAMKAGGDSVETKDEAMVDELQKDEDAQNQVDVMAQQLKFVACLKILMEELSTLATGFEVDGGQLRYQLYIWLEKEVEALKELCSYSSSDSADSIELEKSPEPEGIVIEVNPKPTLHEILVQEKLDFEAKVHRAAKRKRWLRANEALLRTLLSYCSLHGATGGLASVRMELMLLLQELQQEKTHQQLLSPLPFPTSLPLLAASVASIKSVIADPIRYLQSLTHDMLETMVNLSQPNTSQNQMLVLRDLAIALSACIYQSLCDSDTFKASLQDSQDVCSTHLVGRKRKISVNENLQIVTLPPKWPGVTSLRALLAREKDEDTPRLTVLLCEAFTATYLALLLYGMVTCDCVILFHVTAHNFNSEAWGRLFGGGVKKLLRTASLSSTNSLQHPKLESQQSEIEEGSGPSNWLNKQRVKLNTKLLGHQPSTMKEDKPTYREQFVPPEMSILAFLLQKPSTSYYIDEVDGESDEEEDDEDVFDAPVRETKIVNSEHSDPNSYSWLVLKLATLRIAHSRLNDFLQVAGLESSELPVASPLIHCSLRALNQWQENLKKELEVRQTPPEYIPGIFVENTTGPPIQKYRQLLESHNTPFVNKNSASPHRLLWNYLVHQEPVQEIFIRAVFGKRKSVDEPDEDETDPEPDLEPVRIIHKEQDSISAFSLNQQNGGLIVVATPRELQEMDISLLLELPAWLEDECELDILNLTKDAPDPTVPPFLVIQSSGDKNKDTQPGSPQSGMSSQSGRGTSVVLKHKVDGVRRITSHPLLPLYLTGGHDGSVQLFEWGHQHPVATPRPPGTYAKVTRLRFSQHGNKFGVADMDGNLSLFQVGLSTNATRPFFTVQCHNKGISDFVFLGSCSLLATAGHSSESKNVCIWDSILPQGKALVTAFTCHDQGASSLVFAPQHQVLISAGKKGDVCLIDVRSKSIRHKFTAHENAVKCIAIDPHEDYFATGSADGDIKIWGVAVPNVLLSLPAEHARSSFFKNIGQGVTQLHVDSHSRLFSCGADGSMKVRQLPDRETLLNHH